MKDKVLLFAVLAFLALFCCFFYVQAGSEHNTSGYAWSENVGWISFNSVTGGGSNYGVNIDPATGDLSGYAWSENIGWVSFNRSDAGNPPQAPFNGGSGPIARYDSGTNGITGWMRVLANGGGWDGWIKFYNASIDLGGEWHGWAWSDIGVGWISFNGADTGAGGSYGVVSIGVVNSPPNALNLGEIPGDYCVSPSHYFSWTYSDDDGDKQSKLQIQLDKEGDFNPPDINPDPVLVGDYTCPNETCDNENNQAVQVEYSATYYWRVKVWDSQGADSGWIYPAQPSFTTKEHRYPAPNFIWHPTNPSEGENVYFTDTSVCYVLGGAVADCLGWWWTFDDATPSTSDAPDPVVLFNSSGSHEVAFRVSDPDGNSCPAEGAPLIKVIDAEWPLPWWKEIIPW